MLNVLDSTEIYTVYTRNNTQHTPGLTTPVSLVKVKGLLQYYIDQLHGGSIQLATEALHDSLELLTITRSYWCATYGLCRSCPLTLGSEFEVQCSLCV